MRCVHKVAHNWQGRECALNGPAWLAARSCASVYLWHTIHHTPVVPCSRLITVIDIRYHPSSAHSVTLLSAMLVVVLLLARPFVSQHQFILFIRFHAFLLLILFSACCLVDRSIASAAASSSSLNQLMQYHIRTIYWSVQPGESVQ